MATPSINDLITPETTDSMLTFELTQYNSGSFPSTNWTPSSKIFNILKTFATSFSDLTQTISNITKMGLLTLSSGDYLTIFAKDFFQEDRTPARAAIVSVDVSIANGFPTQNIQRSGLTFKAPSGLRYTSNNTSTVSVAGNSTVNFQFIAQEVGSKYNNINLISTLTALTNYPGMTLRPHDIGDGTCLIQQGNKAETDDLLTIECQEKWSLAEGTKKTPDWYKYTIQNVPDLSTIPNKIYVIGNLSFAGSVDITIFGPSGPISNTDLGLITDNLNSKKSVCETIVLKNATQVNITISADVYYFSSNTGAQADIQAGIVDYFVDLGIGGTVYLSDIIDIIEETNGVKYSENWKLNGNPSDFVLTNLQAGVPAFNLNMRAV